MVTKTSALPGPVRWALGAGALSTAFVTGAAVAGGFTDPGPRHPVDTVTPVASKDSLHAFGDCGRLLDWYVESNLRDVGPYGWKQPPYPIMYGGEEGLAMTDGAIPRAELRSVAPQAGSDAASAEAARSNSETGTNVQELGVDEPDVAKTDGSLLVRLVGSDTVVLTDVSAAEPVELARYRLPAAFLAQDLLLVDDDHVLVTASSPMVLKDAPTDSLGGPVGRIAPALPRTTTVLDLDVADPRHPQLAGTDTYSGEVLALRRYGDVVRVVTTTPRPELDWVHPGLGYDEDEATDRNREILRDSTIADWLPEVTDEDGDRRALDCQRVLRPGTDAGDATLAVFGYRPGDESAQDADVVAVTTDSDVVYSSPDRIYVATTRTSSDFWRKAYGRITGQEVPPARDSVTTQLHGFALDGDRAAYVGSGHVAGTVRDRWSLDEQDGRLRVAVSLPGEWGETRENGVAVLEEHDGALEQVGHVDGLGPDEELKAVRWFGDFAVVVTFRQTDPLYTIDFSDPEHPKALGELKVPGYSGYLHPIGDGLVIGVGQDATLQGSVLGGQVAVFDVGDLRHPRRLDQLSLPESGLTALQDPRAFTWLPGAAGTGTAFTAFDDWRTGQVSALRLEVGGSGRLHAEDLGPVPGLRRAVPLDDGRVALVGDGVRLVDAG